MTRIQTYGYLVINPSGYHDIYGENVSHFERYGQYLCMLTCIFPLRIYE